MIISDTYAELYCTWSPLGLLVSRSGVFELNHPEINSPDLRSAAETDRAPGVVGTCAELRTYIYKNRPTGRGREFKIKKPNKKVMFFSVFSMK